jgi:hypothetical protein
MDNVHDVLRPWARVAAPRTVLLQGLASGLRRTLKSLLVHLLTVEGNRTFYGSTQKLVVWIHKHKSISSGNGRARARWCATERGLDLDGSR